MPAPLATPLRAKEAIAYEKAKLARTKDSR